METNQVSFEGIKNEIITYLKNQDTFKDYNFAGPAITTLVDALAYTSHYLIRYANFSLNECFLDSAQLRHNVLSQAKQIGYLPYQYKSAKANITVRCVLSSNYMDLNGVKVPEGLIFSGTNEDGTTFVFRTTEETMFQKDAAGFYYANFDIVEGTMLTDSYVQDELYTSRYYLLNNEIDTDYLTVKVYQSETDKEGIQYTRAESLADFGLDIKNDETTIKKYGKYAKLYYIQEAYNGKLEIYFGDNKMSQGLEPYNIIKVRYLLTVGPRANNIAEFKMLGSIDTYQISDFQIFVNTPSYGGADRESIESIKSNAPVYYQAQDRAVTVKDYNALLTNKFGGWLKAVTSWGGEDNVPAMYGQVFLCCLGKYSEILSPRQKAEITEYLENKNLPDIDVIITDPEPIYVNALITVDWHPYNTTISKANLTANLISITEKHFEQNISSFNSKLRYSQLLMELTNSNRAIDNLLVSFTLQKNMKPDYRIATTYKIEFMNPIMPTSVIIGPWTIGSNTYSISDFIEGKKTQIEAVNDDIGTMYLSKSVANGTYSTKKIGTVNYKTGEISINTYQFDAGVGKNIMAVAVPNILNLKTAKNAVLKLNGISVQVEDLI